MSGDTLGGSARGTVGDVKEAFGHATGDTKTKAEGKLDQARGAIEENYGAIRESAEDAIDSIVDTVREYPISAVLIAAAIGWLIGGRR